MAKKELVENIVKLYSKLGGNMNDVLGSRSNVTFLGTGRNPEPFVEMDINMEAVGALGKSKILEELKSPMGYLTANKLNDIQATKLYNNMLKLEDYYYPKQVSNIIDLGPGTGVERTITRNLDQEGLGALRARGAQKPKMTGDENLDYDFVETPEGYVKVPGSEGAFYRFGKKNKEFIDRSAANIIADDLPPPGSRGGPDDIAAPIQSAEETIRQLRIQDPDLANQVRRMVDEGIISTVGNKGGNPAKRASAREFLVEALKADDTFATKLGTIVDAQDVKFITEGGGGVAGGPLRLVEKYFGPRILEALPAGATGEDIITFTRRVMDNVEDAKGLKPDNPRFDRFTAQFVDEMAKGGRAGFRLGKNVFKGIAELFKKGGDDVDLIKQEKTFREGPITMKFLDEVDRGMANKFIRTRDMKGPQGYGLYESMADMPKGLQAAEFIKNIRGPRGNVDYERAEMYIGGGVKLTGKETVDELIEMFLNAVKQPLAKGGLAKILEV